MKDLSNIPKERVKKGVKNGYLYKHLQAGEQWLHLFSKKGQLPTSPPLLQLKGESSAHGQL